MKEKWKQPLAWILSAAMIFNLSGVVAFADEEGASQPVTICNHHVHDESCGYSEGTPCTHEHTEECYTEVTSCIHQHTSECYSDDVLPAEDDVKTADTCTHQCSEESGCITKVLNCQHVHDDNCGYATGSPCTFDPADCELCNPKNEGTQEHCSCTTLCTEGEMNKDCPVCGAEDANLSECKGQAQSEECTCTLRCTEGSENPDCPVCSAEGADLSACKGAAPALLDECNCADKCLNSGYNNKCPVCSQGDGWKNCTGCSCIYNCIDEKKTDSSINQSCKLCSTASEEELEKVCTGNGKIWQCTCTAEDGRCDFYEHDKCDACKRDYRCCRVTDNIDYLKIGETEAVKDGLFQGDAYLGLDGDGWSCGKDSIELNEDFTGNITATIKDYFMVELKGHTLNGKLIVDAAPSAASADTSSGPYVSLTNANTEVWTITDGVEVKDCKLTLGINGRLDVRGEGVKATNSDVEIQSNLHIQGEECGLEIQNGTLKFASNTEDVDISGGTNGIEVDGSVTICNGDITITGKESAIEATSVSVDPQAGTELDVQVGSSASDAQSIDGSPFSAQSDISDKIANKAYFHCGKTLYTITVKTEGEGTAYTIPASANPGDTVALVALPSEGWCFKDWVTDDESIFIEDSGNNIKKSITMPNENVTLTAVFEEKEPVELTLIVGGTTVVKDGRVEKSSGDGWSYADGVLTLTNADISGSSAGGDDATNKGIYAKGDLTIRLEGNSTVRGDKDFGILVEGDLTVEGSGSLTAEGVGVGVGVDRYNLEVHNGNLTINGGCTITAENGIYLYTPQTYQSTKMIVNDGNITAGIIHLHCSDSSQNAEMVVNGGVINAQILIGTASLGSSLTVNGGTINATGTESGISLVSDNSTCPMRINGGTINATGTKYGIELSSSFNICQMQISGGTITASGGEGAIYVNEYGDYNGSIHQPETDDVSSFILSPTDGMQFVVKAGSSANSAEEIDGSPFARKTDIINQIWSLENMNYMEFRTEQASVEQPPVERPSDSSTAPEEVVEDAGSTTAQPTTPTLTAPELNGQLKADEKDLVATVEGSSTKLDVVVKEKVFSKLAAEKSDSLTITTEEGLAVSLDADSIDELQELDGDIRIRLYKTSVSNESVKQVLDGHPAYKLSLSVDNGSSIKTVSTLKNPVGISVPYTLKKGETAGSLMAVRIVGDKVEWLINSSYDAQNGQMIFSAEQLGTYAIVVKEVPVYTDIENHWAKDAIEFAAVRGLLTGSDGRFYPDNAATEGDLIHALAVLTGTEENAVAWAQQKGIVGSEFDQNKALTNEQLAMLLKAYCDKLGIKLNRTLDEITFADDSSISKDAESAVKAMQQAGVMYGSKDNTFAPTAQVTRAQLACVLQNFVEAQNFPQSANGWQHNNVGEVYYFATGKRVNNWKKIDGKWYYFYDDGAMAVDTQIGNYEVGTDGVRK